MLGAYLPLRPHSITKPGPACFTQWQETDVIQAPLFNRNDQAHPSVLLPELNSSKVFSGIGEKPDFFPFEAGINVPATSDYSNGWKHELECFSFNGDYGSTGHKVPSASLETVLELHGSYQNLQPSASIWDGNFQVLDITCTDMPHLEVLSTNIGRYPYQEPQPSSWSNSFPAVFTTGCNFAEPNIPLDISTGLPAS